ncbi:MAG: NnrS family protein [Epsilonproteobacteria bacterium]|nr:NnrS family protein [Campylobacterota bacterium]
MQEEKLNATNHYLYYPDDKGVPQFLAYGFRPIFLLLAPYMIISMVLWGLVWSGTVTIPFMSDTLNWHMYEMLFGLATAGIMAFLFTGLPELYPGWVPLIGWRLFGIVLWWLAGRVTFWMIDIVGVEVVAFTNISLLVWIIWFAKDVVLDPLQRHASIAYTVVVILGIEIWYFAAQLGYAKSASIDILKIAVGAFVVLTLLALRRVNMEAVNETMEDQNIDDIFISPPPRYNLAIFTVTLYTVAEFFYPDNSITGWIALASAAALLGILNDYILKDESILDQPYVWYLGVIVIMLAVGYGLIGWDILTPDFYGINHFRHFITSGGIAMAYLVVMIIISYIHTGRHLQYTIWTHLMVGSMTLASILRGVIAFFEGYASLLHILSAFFWVVPFVIYIGLFFNYLVSARADGVKG